MPKSLGEKRQIGLRRGLAYGKFQSVQVQVGLQEPLDVISTQLTELLLRVE